MTSNAELTFGAVSLLSPVSAPGDYEIEATAEGTSWGNPAAVVATVASMLMDGERSKITRFGNREATVPLQIRGATLDIVAAGEAALMAEVNLGRNTLTWLPPGWSTASVFDVVYSTLEFQFDDLAEVNQVTRYFTLTLVCLPFARRAELSTVTATSGGALTVTPINDATSTAGWTFEASGAVVSGAIEVTPVATGMQRASAEVAAAYTLTATEYAVWDLELPAGGVGFGFGSALGTVMATESLGGGVVRYYVQPTGAAFPFSVASSAFSMKATGGSTITIHGLAKYNRLPTIGAGYQQSFSLSVEGTARSTIDLVLETATGNVGSECLLFSAPSDALSPPLRRFRTSGTAETTDVAMLSGARSTFVAPSVFTIPASLVKRGTYLMAARLSGSGVVTFSWTADTSNNVYVSSATNITGSVDLTLGGGYKTFTLGVLDLPTVDVDPESSASVRITLSSSLSSASLDELWLFDIDSGVLTWINGLSTPGTKLEVRSATIDRDRPGWFMGSAGTDALNVSVAERCESLGVHQLPPGLATVFAVTPGSTTATVVAEYFDRYLHHVPTKVS